MRAASPRSCEASTKPDSLPAFLDQGLRFTAILFRKPTETASAPISHAYSANKFTPAELRVIEAIAAGGSTVSEIAAAVGRSDSSIQKTLQRLRRSGKVAIVSGRGAHDTYYALV